MGRTPKEMANFFARFQDKHVCANCFHYSKGLCACRELSDMIRGANACPDWQPRETE